MTVDLRLYAIVDPERAGGRDLDALARRLAEGGATLVQLRDKLGDTRRLVDEARAIKAALAPYRVPLVMNDRVDVALAAGADGVHLPAAGIPPADARRLLPPSALVGVSCHSAEDVARARDGGASYAFLSPIFDTPSKRGYGSPLGVEALRAASKLGLPLVALGGVTPERVPALLAAGAAGVAAIRAWLEGADPATSVAALVAGASRARG